MRKKYAGIIIVLIAVGLFALLTHHWLVMPPVQPHYGDGKFKNISWRWPWVTFGIPVPGYTIEFPHFMLAETYEAEFHIRHLPDIGAPVVYLCIDDPDHRLPSDEARKLLTAKIRFDVTDEGGTTVCQVDQPLAKMVWAEPEGGANSYGLYLIPDSYLNSQKQGQYKLHVSYTPDPRLASFQGFVYIRCGGSI